MVTEPQWDSRRPPIQKADPATRRQAMLLVVVSTVVGALIIAVFEFYKAPLFEWFQSDPEQLRDRLALLLVLLGAFLVPLLAFAAYLWSFGRKVIHAQQFPLPGHRVIRDTIVKRGAAAVRHGQICQVLALGLSLAVVLGWVLLWYIASSFDARLTV